LRLKAEKTARFPKCSLKSATKIQCFRLQLYYIHLLGIDYTPVQYAFLVVLAVVVSIGTVGAAAATTLVAATEGQLDKAVYNGEVEVPAAEAV